MKLIVYSSVAHMADEKSFAFAQQGIDGAEMIIMLSHEVARHCALLKSADRA